MPFIENANSNNPIILSGLPVSVAVVYNTLGDFKPLYICVVDLYNNACKTKVEYIKDIKNIKGGVSFCCVYKSGDILKEVMLLYYLNSHIWLIES